MVDTASKYRVDLFFSIGSVCRPAYHLQRVGFRQFACPLDWQMGYSCETVIHLFESSFEDFFKEIEEDLTYEKSYRKIYDVNNRICSIHHFKKEIDIYQAQEDFCKVMKRRYIRLDSQIRKSKVVGLVCNRQVSKESLIDFINRFSQLYPNQKFVLINVYNKSIDGKRREILIISNRVEIHSYTFNDDVEGVNKWQGNHEGWNWVLGHYCLGRKQDIELCKSYLLEDKKLLIYGAGKMAHKVIDYLLLNNISITGIAVTDMEENPYEIMGMKVKCITEYELENCVCIVSVEDEEIRECIMSELQNKSAYKVGYYLSRFGNIKFVDDNG